MGQKVQNIRRRKEGSERNAAKDMPGEGILSMFSLPRKNNDQEMNCKISRSQPTTKRAKKFIIQNIKIATTPVVPIPFGLQDVVKIATPDSCSPDYKISRSHQ